ncbi:hypothetical protein V499_00868 [Pseudogymnoascus sp. VKM F-103]|nr:hypothetical protein V499_00868 [Pseudogymnoascus sp. VKM F-103]
MHCVETYLDEPADIPVIDFRQLNGTQNERSVAFKYLDDAFQSLGFIYLSNHSIPQKLIDEAFEWSRRFFALPHDVKKRIAHPPSGAVNDYLGFLEIGQVLTTPERHEGLELCNPHDLQVDVGRNLWLPEDIFPGFRSFYDSWWDACTRLDHQLLENISELLKLGSPKYLSNQHTCDFCHMSFNYFPSMEVGPLKSREVHRMNAHTDFQQLTIVFNDSIGGLEIHDGEAFRPVIPKQGKIIVDVGDILDRQTNGRSKSALHQVVAPRESMIGNRKDSVPLAAGSVVDRYSLAFFGMPDPEFIIETLPGCEAKGKWAQNMVGEWGQTVTTDEWLAKRVSTEFPAEAS